MLTNARFHVLAPREDLSVCIFSVLSCFNLVSRENPSPLPCALPQTKYYILETMNNIVWKVGKKKHTSCPVLLFNVVPAFNNTKVRKYRENTSWAFVVIPVH